MKKNLVGASRAERAAWAQRTFAAFCEKVTAGTPVMLLAARNYAEFLVPLLQGRGHVVTEPLAGLSQGRRLQRLRELTDSSLKRGMPQGTADHAARFHAIMDRLFDAQKGGRRLGECRGSQRWPERGVYFFFEPGEYRAAGSGRPRIVRVGTHATTEGAKSTLWGRLSNHRGHLDGGGNHRSSVFRRHAGMAMMRRDPERLVVPSWAGVLPSDGDLLAKEQALEALVSTYLGRMTLLWLSVDDPPSPTTARSVIERNSIALLSGAARHAPSAHWLGAFSDRPAIRKSGLWNVNYVDDPFDPDFFPVLEHCVAATIDRFGAD